MRAQRAHLWVLALNRLSVSPGPDCDSGHGFDLGLKSRDADGWQVGGSHSSLTEVAQQFADADPRLFLLWFEAQCQGCRAS